MTTKHTPGPWTHHPEDNIILDASGRRLIEWQARSVSVSVEERDANARLIAAAPELLDLLSALECDINTLVYCYERKPDNFGRAVAVAKADAERAREAIAKARGAQ